MVHLRLPLTVCILVLLASAAYGEVPIMPKEVLQNRATHIVTGEVRKIYTHEKKGEKWHRTEGVVEIAVSEVEKGEGIKPEDLVYAKFWTQWWIGTGTMPTGSNGHSFRKDLVHVRVYLERKNGGYGILLPNGLESVQKDASSAKR